MRNLKWLRYGIATASIIGLACAGTLAACGDDDDGATGTPDAGKDNNVTPTDSGGTDSGGNDSGGGDSGPKPQPAKIIVVHAATAYSSAMMGTAPGSGTNPAGTVRVCYATKTATDPDFTLSPLPPLPHSVSDGGAPSYAPGIPIGAGGPFPSTGLPLEGIAIRPYIIDAVALADRGVVGNGATLPRCNKLLTDNFVPDGGFPDGGTDGSAGGGSLVKNVDYWQLADIPAGTLKNDHTYVLAIYGCAADADTNVAGPTGGGGKCGAGFTAGGPGNGNLTVFVFEIDATTTVASDELGVQFADMSPAWDAVHAAAAAVVPEVTPTFNSPDAGDAGFHYLGADGGPATFTFQGASTKATPVVKLKGVVTSSAYFAANDSTPPASAGTPYAPIPINNTGGTPPGTVQYISEGYLSPTAANLYVNGKTYTFFLVGDPGYQPAGTADALRSRHYIAFPNQFTPPAAQ